MRALIWTRTVKDWEADAELLTALLPASMRLLRLPCLRLTARPGRPAREAYDAAVLTSANGVGFALASPELAARLRATPRVYTHGAATAQALQAAGIAGILVEGARTAAELGSYLRSSLPAGASVLLPAAAEPAYDLAGTLAAAGFAAESVICYATEAVAQDERGIPLTAASRERMVKVLGGAACFASPSAVAGFVKALAPATNRLRRAVVAVAIGPTTAAAAQPEFERVVTAPENGMDSLVKTAVAALSA